MPDSAKPLSCQLVDGHSAPRFKRGHVIDGRYKLQRRIGQGRYSDVYEAVRIQDDQKCAVKVDKEDASPIMLKWENQVLLAMQAHEDKEYFCKYINSGVLEDGSVYIAMELLGENLSEYRKRQSGQRFSKRKAAGIVGHMLGCIEVLHSEGFIHRDLKPSNFGRLRRVLCDSARKNLSKLIDFGLARKWRSDEGKILKPRTKAEFRGTTKYASVNAHAKKELSRRDDLFSLFFITVHFLTGDLPWLQSSRDEAAALKTEFMNDPKDLPLPMREFLSHLQSLKFDDAPDYELLKSCLQKLAHLDSPQLGMRGKPEQVSLADNDIAMKTTPPHRKISSPILSPSLTPPPIAHPSPSQTAVSPSASAQPPSLGSPPLSLPPPPRSDGRQRQHPLPPPSPPHYLMPLSPSCTLPPRPCHPSAGPRSDRSRFPESQHRRHLGEDAFFQDRGSRSYDERSARRPLGEDAFFQDRNPRSYDERSPPRRHSGDLDRRHHLSRSSERNSLFRDIDHLSLSDIWRLPVCHEPLKKGFCERPRCTYWHPPANRVKNNGVSLCFDLAHRGWCSRTAHCPFYHWNQEEKACYLRTGCLPEVSRRSLAAGRPVSSSRPVSTPLREAFSSSTAPPSSASRPSYNLPARPGSLLSKGPATRIPKVGQEVEACEAKLSAPSPELQKHVERTVSHVPHIASLPTPNNAANRTEGQASTPKDVVVSSSIHIPDTGSRAPTSSQEISCTLPISSSSARSSSQIAVDSSMQTSMRARKMKISSIQRSWSRQIKSLRVPAFSKSGKATILTAIRLRTKVCSKAFKSRNNSQDSALLSKPAQQRRPSEALRNAALCVQETWNNSFPSVVAPRVFVDVQSMAKRRRCIT